MKELSEAVADVEAEMERRGIPTQTPQANRATRRANAKRMRRAAPRLRESELEMRRGRQSG